MARVPVIEQLGRRDLLVVCWQHIPELIGVLPPTAQWEIHSFYGLSYTLTYDEFLARMRSAKKAQPSLAQKVGKHYSLIFSTSKHYADQVGKYEWELIRQLVIRDYTKANADPLKKKSVVIMPLVRPEPDVTKLAYAFKTLAEQINREDKAA